MPVPAKREVSAAGRRKGRWVSKGKHSELMIWNKELRDGVVAFSVVANGGDASAVAGILPKGATQQEGRPFSRSGGVLMSGNVLRHPEDMLVARVQTNPPRVEWYTCCDLSDSTFITAHELSPSSFPLTPAIQTQGLGIKVEMTDITRKLLRPTAPSRTEALLAEASAVWEAAIDVDLDDTLVPLPSPLLPLSEEAVVVGEQNREERDTIPITPLEEILAKDAEYETQSQLQAARIALLEQQLEEASIRAETLEAERQVLQEEVGELKSEVQCLNEAADAAVASPVPVPTPVPVPAYSAELEELLEALEREKARRTEALKEVARREHELQDMRGKVAFLTKKLASQSQAAHAPAAEESDEAREMMEEQLKAKIEEIACVQSCLAEMKDEMLANEKTREADMQALQGENEKLAEQTREMELELLRAVRRAEEMEQNTQQQAAEYEAQLSRTVRALESGKREAIKSSSAAHEVNESHEKIERDLRESLKRAMGTIEGLSTKMKDQTDALKCDSQALLNRPKLAEMGTMVEQHERHIKELTERTAAAEERADLAEEKIAEWEEELRKPRRSWNKAWVRGLRVGSYSEEEEDDDDDNNDADEEYEPTPDLIAEKASLELELYQMETRAAGAEAALVLQNAESAIRMAELVTELADTASYVSTEESMRTASPYYACSEASSDDQSTYPYSPKALPMYFPYDQLRLPSYLTDEEVDPAHREQYLSPLEFQSIFHMNKAEFSQLTQTERDARKRALHLL